MGGIKIHASIDMVIRKNRLHNCGRGLWLDWMAQGTHVYRNLLYDNTTDDIFMEVNHGPFLIENNIMLSPISVRDWSEGGAFVHNLIAGNIELRPQGRETHSPSLPNTPGCTRATRLLDRRRRLAANWPRGQGAPGPQPRAARRQLDQQRAQSALGQPQRQSAGQPQSQHRPASGRSFMGRRVRKPALCPVSAATCGRTKPRPPVRE